MLRRYASPGQAPSARGTSPQPSCLSFEHTLSFRFMATKRMEADVEAPRPTVREAMRSVLSAAKLVAGADGLDRQVEWVRLMETPEVQPRAGDLMFTSGFPIKDDLDAQIRLVGRIAEGGGAGLVVRPLPYLRKLPPEMVSEADRLKVPLFTIASDVQFVDLMTPLLERIINAEHWRLKRSIEIHRRFTELVLDGKGVNEICRTLADLLESAVVVEDASFHLLAHAGGSADPHRKETILRQGTPQRVLFDPQIQRMLREVEARRGPLKVPAFPHLGMSRERLIAPILSSNQVLGYISVLDHPPHNEELAFMAIEQAALVLALSIAKERELSEVEGRVRGEYLEDLLHGTYGDEAAAQRRARHLGYPLHGSHIVVLVDIDDFRGFNRARQISEDAIQALKREFLRRVTGVVRASYPRALVQGRSDQVVALLPLGAEPGDHQARSHALGLQIRQAVAEWKPGFTVSVGFSAPAEAPGAVAGALREVTSVMESLARFKRWIQVVAVPELGLTWLLAAVIDGRLTDLSVPPSLSHFGLAAPGALPEARAACGMGFVATPELGHEAVALGVQALARLAHRGGLDADGKSGDGAGLLIQVPHRLLGGAFAVVSLFAWDERAQAIVEEAVARHGMRLATWRAVPLDPDSLGSRARETMPAIWHALVDDPGLDPEAWETALYLVRRDAERNAESDGVRMYIASCSSRTLVYKGLMAGTRLADFYPDLEDGACESKLAVFHQRYSTNTMPDWRLAQPFRMLAHNGEINTVTGNRAWMRAREAELEPELRGAIWPEGSDSASLDNALELLVQRGWEVSEALMSLVPDAWEGRGDLASAVRDFYRYQSIRFEPWDGPAALAFSDGIVVGAALDRNGLRPLRWQRTRDGLVAAASEAGVVSMPPEDVVERGKLGPGQMLLVDTRDGSLLRDADAKERAAARHDYGMLADRILVPVERHQVDLEPLEDLPAQHALHGWGFEDVKFVVDVMAESAAEPVYSMGDDIPIAPLGRTPRRVYGYLRQRFAQVTNPAIDPLREKAVMSLRVLLGSRERTLEPEGGADRDLLRRHHPAVPTEDKLLELESPVLGAAELGRVLEDAVVLDATYAPDETLRDALLRLCREASEVQGVIDLSDRRSAQPRLPVPMALAVGAVHSHLLATGRRMSTDIVAIAGDAVDVHDVACLITIGATAVHPYLAFATVGDEAAPRYRKALEAGLLKVMAKMGISCVTSYRGGEVLEALGLGAEVMEMCFAAVPSRIGGMNLDDIERLARTRPAQVPDHGRVRFRKAGEHHAYNPLAVRAAQKAAESGDAEAYRE